MNYSTERCSWKYRMFAFTVLIFSTYARLIRWNCSGAVVTERFNHKLATAGRVSVVPHMARKRQARKDIIARDATADETKIMHEKLKKWEPTIKRRMIVFMILDGGEEREFIGGDTMADSESLRGRATRAYPVWDTKMKDVRFLKDLRRGANFERESDILTSP